MKLIGLTKLTTSNLLSLLGYPGILCFLYIRFIFFPIDWADLEGYHYDRDMLGFVSSAMSALYFMLACLICAVFFVLILIEFFIRKKNKTEFQLINKIPLIKFLINLNFCIEFYSGQDSFLFRLLVLWVCFSCTCFLKYVSTTRNYF